jgi:hypothetical protein
MVYLDSLFNAEELKTGAHRWMLNHVIAVNVLDLRIRDAAVVFEERR